MLEQYLGAERFRKGIAAYLRKHQYANAETGDLWDALERASDEPVRKLMDSWIFQPGFPMVEANLKADGCILWWCVRGAFSIFPITPPPPGKINSGRCR